MRFPSKALDRILKAYVHDRRAAGATYVERADYTVVSPDGNVIRPLEFMGILKGGMHLETGIIIKWNLGALRICFLREEMPDNRRTW